MRNRIFLPFKKARRFARAQGIKSVKEWYEYSKSGKKPSNFPSNPQQVYKEKGWKGYRDFLKI